jgi:adenylyltransferase/sulfurtransferase
VKKVSQGKSTTLSTRELDFYSRQIVLPEIGYHGQLRLKNAKVCIAGLGGLGSPAALQLASLGVGHLRLVDYDIVEVSNLQRQLLYTMDNLGYPKVEAAAKRLSNLNPHIKIEPLPLALNINNVEEIIRNMDVVVDGLDNMTARYAINRACQKSGVPYVFGAAITTYGNISTIIPGETPCLECFQGNLDDDRLPKCAVVGVHPSLLSIVASIEVSEATRIILGVEPKLAGKIFYCDLENLAFETIEISKVENCPVCGSIPTGFPKPLKQGLINEICGREGKRVFVITPKADLNLNMNNVHNLLENKGFKIQLKANLGITFHKNLNEKVSLLKSGVMILEGMKSEKDAYSFYRGLISDQLETPLSNVEWTQ